MERLADNITSYEHAEGLIELHFQPVNTYIFHDACINSKLVVILYYIKK